MRKIRITLGKVALVDDDKFDFLNQWKWSTAKRSTTFYAQRTSYKPVKKTIYMHNFVLKKEGSLDCDHIDGNGLNNQKENLRYVSRRKNAWNNLKRRSQKTSSIYPGVYLHKARKHWYATFYFDGKRIFIGSFRDQHSAGLAHKKALETIKVEEKK